MEFNLIFIILLLLIAGISFIYYYVNQISEKFKRDIRKKGERLEKEKLEKERLEKERLEKEKLEKERLEKELEIEMKNIQNSFLDDINEFLNEIKKLKENYIRNSHIKELESKYNDNIHRTLLSISEEYLLDESKEFIKQWKEFENGFKSYNKSYIENELKKSDDLFSDINGKSLDYQQRYASVMDEDNNLIIAGAGSGKTLTIEGKVTYLIKEKNIKPNEILLLTFTKAAAGEMEERINNSLQLNIFVSTFHALGLNFIRRFKDDDVEEYPVNIIERYFRESTKDENIAKNLMEFFSLYLNFPKDYSKYETIEEYLLNNTPSSYQTLKGMINLESEKLENNKIEHPDEYFEEDKRITYKGENVKSIEELLIANFLFINGIEYEYEKRYYDKFKNFNRYNPDFCIKTSTGKEIYLEHFAIDKNGETPSFFSKIESKKYKMYINKKRKLHKDNGTKLIETYSYYQFEGILLDKLNDLLIKNDIKFNPLSNEEILSHLNLIKNRFEFKKSIKIFSTFLSLFKSNNYNIDTLNEFKKESSKNHNPSISKRENLFFKIFEPLYLYYQNELKMSEKIDFDDMINLAIKAVPDIDINYKHIIIDEYQDTTYSKYKLVKEIRDKTNASLTVVGDDWQSIYRFLGSDISLFTDFENFFGTTEKMKIEKTYRNTQELIDIAGKFVMKNPKQIPKYLKSNNLIQKSSINPEETNIEYKKNPILIFGYSNDKDKALIKSLKIIYDDYKKLVMLLGRNKNDAIFIEESDYFEIDDKKHYQDYRKVHSKLFPNFEIRFYTVHKSKGLEADEVIIVNNENATLGFPNQIGDDDEILRYVLTKPDDFLHSEERRLFYVALTRTKNHCILLTDIMNHSTFVNEFKELGVYYEEFEALDKVNCPKCKTGLIKIKEGKIKEGFKEQYLKCTNNPPCDFTDKLIENKQIIKKKIKCPICGSFMVKRMNRKTKEPFLGCLGFPYCRKTQKISYLEKTIKKSMIKKAKD